MVYCGKPSASCATCRAKKTRCDKIQPACGQCQRSGQKCPGYHNPQLLVFRDESSRVIDKLQLNTKKKQRQRIGLHAKDATTLGQEQGARNQIKDTQDNDKLSSPPPPHASLCRESNEAEFGDDDQLHVGGLGLNLALDATYIDNPSLMISSYSCPRSPISALRPCFKDLGVNYFISHFVITESGPSPGYFAYVPKMLSSFDSENVLVLAVEAVGLACLANTTNHVDMMSQACSSFSNTLNILNQSIVDPQESLKDSTMLSVVLLGLFESVTCRDRSSLEAWTKHNRGAAALVAHRGAPQFDTPLGLQIFHDTISNLLISCSRARLPIANQIRLLRAQASTFTKPSSPGWIVVGALIEIMELSHCVRSDQIESQSENDLERYLVRAVEIDRDLESHFAHIPLEWRYKTVEDPFLHSEYVYEGKYHVYQNIWMSKVWNSMRACRILANLIIGNLLKRVPVTSGSSRAYAGLAQRKAEIFVLMRDAILCSVPQSIGDVDHQKHLSPSAYSESTPDHTGCASSCYYLLWNLYLAGTLPDTSEEMKLWITGRLRAINNVMGIRMAQLLAEILESGDGSAVHID